MRISASRSVKGAQSKDSAADLLPKTKGHEWQAVIGLLAKGRGCKQCFLEGISQK